MAQADRPLPDDEGAGGALRGMFHAVLLSLPLWGIAALAVWWILD